MELIASLASWVLIVAGGGFLLIGSLGVLRMPDFYTRMHAASLVDTLGATLMILGMGIEAGLTLVAVKLGLILLFLYLTSPVSAHALAGAAMGAGLRPQLAEDRTAGQRASGRLANFPILIDALGDGPAADRSHTPAVGSGAVSPDPARSGSRGAADRPPPFRP